MVYVEPTNPEPIIAQHPRESWLRPAKHHSPTRRWFLMGALAAVMVFFVFVIIGWGMIQSLFASFSL